MKEVAKRYLDTLIQTSPSSQLLFILHEEAIRLLLIIKGLIKKGKADRLEEFTLKVLIILDELRNSVGPGDDPIFRGLHKIYGFLMSKLSESMDEGRNGLPGYETEKRRNGEWAKVEGQGMRDEGRGNMDENAKLRTPNSIPRTVSPNSELNTPNYKRSEENVDSTLRILIELSHILQEKLSTRPLARFKPTYPLKE